MKRYAKLIILIVIVIFITRCDLEKLSSYKYDTDPIPEAAKIYGTLTDKFTADPVAGALILVQNQATVTDNNGKYLLYYHFTQDEDRNNPVTLRIQEENYLTLDTSIVIFPENEINAFLTYASPIIKKIALVDSIGVCQAIISDYQGYRDIVFVEVNLAYRIPGEKFPSLYTKVRMNRVITDSLETSYYQLRAPVSIVEYGNLMNIYEVYVEDRLKYSDTMTSMEVGASDSLLFPIVY